MIRAANMWLPQSVRVSTPFHDFLPLQQHIHLCDQPLSLYYVYLYTCQLSTFSVSVRFIQSNKCVLFDHHNQSASTYIRGDSEE